MLAGLVHLEVQQSYRRVRGFNANPRSTGLRKTPPPACRGQKPWRLYCSISIPIAATSFASFVVYDGAANRASSGSDLDGQHLTFTVGSVVSLPTLFKNNT